jgi:hypothetical protein
MGNELLDILSRETQINRYILFCIWPHFLVLLFETYPRDIHVERLGNGSIVRDEMSKANKVTEMIDFHTSHPPSARTPLLTTKGTP